MKDQLKNKAKDDNYIDPDSS